MGVGGGVSITFDNWALLLLLLLLLNWSKRVEFVGCVHKNEDEDLKSLSLLLVLGDDIWLERPDAFLIFDGNILCESSVLWEFSWNSPIKCIRFFVELRK